MVKFTNTDERQVALVCRWLRQVFDIDEDRLRVSLHLHEGLDLREATLHWSRVTAAARPVHQGAPTCRQ
ncbi:hypothetical protein BH23ACT9_BH23ACT9_38770 [soil metagenome]